MNRYDLGCRCGRVGLTVTGPPIMVVECLCKSCQEAADQLAALPVAVPLADQKGATPFVMQRKDRVSIVRGHDALGDHHLTPESSTRRVIATCCNTPMFLEFKAGHWLSLYASLWPASERPAVEMRTMTGARHDLPADVPNLKTHSLRFFRRLLGAWVRMGFRSPTIGRHPELKLPR